MAAPKNRGAESAENAEVEDIETLELDEPKFFKSSTPDRKPGKDQSLLAALQIASGRMLVNDYDDVFDVLTYMCGLQVNALSYPDAITAARKELFRQYPKMAQLEHADFPRDIDDIEEWVKEQIKVYGEKIRIDKIPTDEAEELSDLVAAKMKAIAPKKPKKKQGTRMSMSV